MSCGYVLELSYFIGLFMFCERRRVSSRCDIRVFLGFQGVGGFLSSCCNPVPSGRDCTRSVCTTEKLTAPHDTLATYMLAGTQVG